MFFKVKTLLIIMAATMSVVSALPKPDTANVEHGGMVPGRSNDVVPDDSYISPNLTRRQNNGGACSWFNDC
jgi:hypothetical protein